MKYYITPDTEIIEAELIFPIQDSDFDYEDDEGNDPFTSNKAVFDDEEGLGSKESLWDK